MAIIKFSNGQSVKFDGTPTPQDIQEVAQRLGIDKVAKIAPGGAPGSQFGNSGSIGNAVANDLKTQVGEKQTALKENVAAGQSKPSLVAQAFFDSVSTLGDAVGDVIGEGAKALGVDKVLENMPTIDPQTGKLTTWGKSLPAAIANIKSSAQHVQAIQQVSSKIQDLMTKHPESTDDIKGLVSALGGILQISGAGDIVAAGGKAIAKVAGEDVAKEAAGGAADAATGAKEAAPAATPTPAKTPGALAAVTPVPKTVKNSIQDLLKKNTPEEVKGLITDIFSQAKAREGNLKELSPSQILANKSLTEASSVLKKGLTEANTAKEASVAKYADTPVTGFNDPETGQFKSLTSIRDDFDTKASDLLSSKTELTNPQDKTIKRFYEEFTNLVGGKRTTTLETSIPDFKPIKVSEDVVGKNTLKDADTFVDRWQNFKLGSSGTNANNLEALINSTVHDVNEATKTAADSVDGGEYRAANSKYSELAQLKGNLEAGMGEKIKTTGRYSNASNFFAKAAKGDSSAQETLRAVEQATGVPITDTSNLAQFAEKSLKIPGIKDIASSARDSLITRFGKLKLVKNVVGALQDSEGALIREVDKASGGNISILSSMIEKSSDVSSRLAQLGLNSKQGALMILLGQVANNSKTSTKK